MPLVRLTYVSSAVDQLLDGVLEDILASSVRHNTLGNITGMLLYCGGNFVQVLEGEEPAVQETYERLCGDPRHRNIYLLGVSPIAERDFPAWRMGFRRLSKRDAADHPAYAPYITQGFSGFRIDARPGVALEMLQRFGKLLR